MEIGGLNSVNNLLDNCFFILYGYINSRYSNLLAYIPWCIHGY